MALLALTACHLYQQNRVSLSLLLFRSPSLSLIVRGAQTKDVEGGLIPSVILCVLYFHFYLLSLLWIYPGRDRRFTAEQIYSGYSRHSLLR